MEANLSCDEIYRILENEIAQLKILPGETLSENTLCRRFHISRTPIRSVLQRLQQNGFVQIVPCKGTIVTSINLKLATQWIFQRLAVECMVLRDFIAISAPTDIARIRYSQELLQKLHSNSPSIRNILTSMNSSIWTCPCIKSGSRQRISFIYGKT